MDSPRLIVVQGGSAVGKTTLTGIIARELGYDAIGKDHFKELLYDTLGVPKDREDSRVYGRAATAALFAVAEQLLLSKKDIVIESAFHKGLAEKDISHLVASTGARVLQLYLFADPQTVASRFNARIATGERHHAHPDKPKQPRDFLQYGDTYGKLGIEPVIEIDTSKMSKEDYSVIIDEIKEVYRG